MKITLHIFLIFFYLTTFGQVNEPLLFKTSDGYVSITSDAPLELISAESTTLKGIINANKQTFAFQLKVESLKGFNSSLQQEHFYENYMETEVYPTAEFSGKIIEKIDVNEMGNHTIRAKGILMIHGINQERIINCKIEVKKHSILVQSKFSVNLADHNITIPKLVYQKIAEEIKININANLTIDEE